MNASPPTPAKPPPPAAPKIRVLCVDDSRDITSTLRLCIAGEPDMTSVGSLHAATNLRAELERTRPDVVLLDVTMPGDDPLQILRDLVDSARSAPVEHAGAGAPGAARFIVFSGRSDQDAVENAKRAGARAYLSKRAEVPVILQSIRQVARGDAPFAVWL